jgi:ADP-ribose pyrophosphatase YjhB (NUDIX family)
MAKHSISVAAVVEREGKILLIRGERRGWEMPGGGVEENEPLHHALVREVMEETGIEILPITPIVVSQNQATGVVSILWLAKFVRGEPMANPPESLEVAWVSTQGIEKYVQYGNFAERIYRTLTGVPVFLYS